MTTFANAGFIRIPAPRNAMPGSSWFRISADSRCFDGHFDGAPILPGVAHLALVLMAQEDQRVLTGVRDVRFTHPLRPGDEVEVILIGKELPAIRFEIRWRGKTATSGLLIFV